MSSDPVAVRPNEHDRDPGATTSWRPTVDRDRREPLFIQIVDGLRRAIRQGELRPGDRLPTNRLLARSLGVSLSTITRAMDEAGRQHLVHARVGRGTFVLGATVDAALFGSTLRHSGDVGKGERGSDHGDGHGESVEWGSINHPPIDLSGNVPARPGRDVELDETLRRLEPGSIGSAYPSPAALGAGQAVFADLLRRRGLSIGDVEVVLAAGAQQALLATLVVTAGAGARVLVEELTFPGMKSAIRHLGLQPIGVPMDEHGLLPDHLERTAAATGARTLVCVPNLQNPTAASMDSNRRDEIAAVCERCDLTVVEDDVYGALQDEPALASILPARTIVVTSLSKTVAPALRLGAIAGRHPSIADLRREVSLTAWTVAPAGLAVAVEWASDGTIDRRTRWQRDEISARSDLLGARWIGTVAPHRWLPTLTDPDRAVEALTESGVVAVPSTALAVTADAPKGLRLSLTAAPDRATLHAAVARLDAAPIRWA